MYLFPICFRCNGLALLAKRLCTSYVDPDGISALVAGRLIALNKCPGVHPIGVGEVMRRSVQGSVFCVEVGYSGGSWIQLCAGQDADSEAAVHEM